MGAHNIKNTPPLLKKSFSLIAHGVIFGGDYDALYIAVMQLGGETNYATVAITGLPSSSTGNGLI